MSALILQLLLASLGLASSIWLWWTKRNDAITKEREDAKKAISEAVASGDNARIHAIIDKLRR